LTVGWRWAFVIFGSLGVFWAYFFARWYRDEPAAHPSINESELRYIRGVKEDGENGAAPGDVAPTADAANPQSEAGSARAMPATDHHRIPWGLVAVNRNIWLLGAINACSSFYSYMLFSWFPTYLKQGRGVDELTSGRLASLPFIFGATGVMLGGFLGDWLTARSGSRRLALNSLGVLGLVTAGLLVASSVYASIAWQAALLCAVGFFFSYVALAGWWAAMGDVGGRHLGALFGLCNMVGLAGGFVSQVFLGRFADYMRAQGYEGRAQWDPAFYLYGAVLIVGGVLWLFVNPRRTVVPEDAKHV
jgi:sugar phosphate permease